MELTYLDNAASEPLRPQALAAMNEAAASLAGIGAVSYTHLTLPTICSV